MTISSPETYVLKTDHIDDTGVASFVTLKFVYPDGHVAYVHLTADEAQVLSAALQLRAAEVKPELVADRRDLCPRCHRPNVVVVRADTKGSLYGACRSCDEEVLL